MGMRMQLLVFLCHLGGHVEEEWRSWYRSEDVARVGGFVPARTVIDSFVGIIRPNG